MPLRQTEGEGGTYQRGLNGKSCVAIYYKKKNSITSGLSKRGFQKTILLIRNRRIDGADFFTLGLKEWKDKKYNTLVSMFGLFSKGRGS